MHKTKKLAAVMIALFMLAGVTAAGQQEVDKKVPSDGAIDPVEFLKLFKMGMSYSEVQKALPKEADQDILSYITTEEVFLLSVDLPGPGSWNATFKFDSMDNVVRRPEQLIEMDFGAGLSMRSESFESLVQKITATFGEPIKVDRTQEKFQQAGWRFSGGSVLTLEYSIASNGGSNNISVEFIIRKSRRRDTPASKAIA